MCATKHVQAGFSLSEVLISVFILAVGVIGAAGMQLTALRTSQQSGFQSSASHLASDMAERMRAYASQIKLQDQVDLYMRVSQAPSAASDSASDAVSTVKRCDLPGSDCQAADWVSADFHDWVQQVRVTLPAGRAVMCLDTVPWRASAGQYSWDCKDGAGASIVLKLGWQEKRSDGSQAKSGDSASPPSIVLTIGPVKK